MTRIELSFVFVWKFGSLLRSCSSLETLRGDFSASEGKVAAEVSLPLVPPFPDWNLGVDWTLAQTFDLN